MARARSGTEGIVVALVCSILATIIFAFVSLFLYIQKGDVTEKMEDAQRDLKKFVNSSEKNRDDIQAYMAGSGTVVGKLIAENEELRNDVSNAKGEISKLNSVLKSAEKKAKKAEKARKRFSKLAKKAAGDLKKTKGDYNNAEKALNKLVDKNASEAKRHYKKIDKMGNTLRKQMKKTRSGLQAKIAELNQKNEGLTAEVERLQGELNAGKKMGSSIPSITTADGQIVEVTSQGTNLVYINRGHNDHLLLGMTFEIFDENELIKLDDYNELRGKATIEIIKVDDRSATARIARLTPGKSVVVGDQIVNAVYNPYYAQKFYIHGKFNLDGKGAPTSEDYKQVVRLVKRWGGKVTDKLTPDVDFVVLGEEPKVPSAAPSNSSNTALIQKMFKAQKDYETYHELAGTALSMQVPVLNQNRFLDLIGYYVR